MDIFIAVMVLFAALAYFNKSAKAGSRIFFGFGVLHLIWAMLMFFDKEHFSVIPSLLLPVGLMADNASIFALLIESLVLFAVSWYNMDFVLRREEKPYQ